MIRQLAPPSPKSMASHRVHLQKMKTLHHGDDISEALVSQSLTAINEN